MTPPSPPSPYTPPEVTLAKWREHQRLAKVRKEQETLIALIQNYLQKFFKGDQFIEELSNIMKTHSSFEKRYETAVVINNMLVEKDLDNKYVCNGIRAKLVKDIFDPTTTLYKALNYQSTALLPLTFYGSMSWLSYNYSRSLQNVQLIVSNEMKLSPLQKPNNDDRPSCFANKK